MRCFYINLDSAVERRRNIEANFKAAAPANWELIRVSALGPADVADRAGTISGPEKGCFLSHRAAVAATAGDDQTVFIVEDDTRFSPRTFSTLETLLASSTPWDLLFTDLTFLDASTMLACAKQYGRLAAARQFMLKDLSGLGFAGAGAYVVRGAAKVRLLAALDGAGPLDLAYDRQLHRLVSGGQLSARACVPFLTAISDDAETSTIQAGVWTTREETVRAFRRLLFVDRDLAALGPEIERLDARYGDAASRLAGIIFGTFISDAFPDKW